MIPILHRKKQKLEEVKERASEGELRPELRLSDLHLSLHTWPHTVSLKNSVIDNLQKNNVRHSLLR